MGVAVEIVPGGVGAVAVGHHLHTFLPAVVVVGLAGGPVGVRQRCAIAPAISCVGTNGTVEASPPSHQALQLRFRSPPSVGLFLRPIHLLLALLYWDKNSSSSWLWMLTRLAPLATQSSLAAPQLFFWDQSTSWKS